MLLSSGDADSDNIGRAATKDAHLACSLQKKSRKEVQVSTGSYCTLYRDPNTKAQNEHAQTNKLRKHHVTVSLTPTRAISS